MTAAPAADRAVIVKDEFRRPDMVAFEAALIRLALDRLDGAADWFGVDDLAEADQPRDGTTSGAAVRALLTAHVIAPSYHHDPTAKPAINFGRRRSKRACCNGHVVQLYKLTSRALAMTWLARNHQALLPAARQETLNFASPPKPGAGGNLEPRTLNLEP